MRVASQTRPDLSYETCYVQYRKASNCKNDTTGKMLSKLKTEKTTKIP